MVGKNASMNGEKNEIVATIRTWWLILQAIFFYHKLTYQTNVVSSTVVPKVWVRTH